VSNDLSEAHVRHVLGAHDALQPRVGHLCAAQAGEDCVGQASAQLRDDPCAIVVARGLAGGEKDARIEVGSDAYEFISTAPYSVAEVR
jgi:hypothetical protein